MTDAPKPKKQEWLDYLLESIGKEKDPNVSIFEARVRAVNDDYREGIIGWSYAEEMMQRLTEEAVKVAREPYRTRILFEATTKYIKNPDLKIDRGFE